MPMFPNAFGDIRDRFRSGALPALSQIATNSRLQDQINTTNTQMMSRSAHLALAALSGTIEVEFANWIVTRTTGTGQSLGNGTEVGPGGVDTVTASVEYPAGTFTQLTSSGSASAAISDGGYAVFVTTALNIPKGARFWVRSYHSCPAGITFTNAQDINNGEALNVGTSGIADQTMSGTVPNTTAPGFIHRAVAIRAKNAPRSAYLLGDSRVWGQNDVYTNGMLGCMERILGNQVPYINGGIRGDRIAFFNATGSKRVSLAKRSCTDVVIQAGINDFYRGGYTAAQVQAAEQQLVQSLLTAGFASDHIWETTKEPISTSTDNWATVANQTVSATTSGQLPGYNNAIRAGLPNVGGYFEIADFAESSRGSGLWAVPGNQGITPDGLHCNLSGYCREAPAVVSSYTLVPPLPAAPTAALLRDAVASAQSGTATASLSSNHTLSADANLLIVALNFPNPYSGSADITPNISVTAGGVPMNLVDYAYSTGSGTTDRGCQVWALYNPPTGTIPIVVSNPQVGAALTSIALTSISYKNAFSPPTQADCKQVSTISGGITSLTATTTSDNTRCEVLAVGSARTTTAPTAGAGQTVLATPAASSNAYGIVTAQPGGAGVTSSISWTTADQGSMLVVPVRSM